MCSRDSHFSRRRYTENWRKPGDSETVAIGSVLPPARQTELHPFGMPNYAVSFMSHTLLCNALGFEQRRYADGELVRTYGEIR